MRRFLACCTAALALGAVAVSGSSASAAPPPGRGSDAAAEHQRVTEYWTPARMAAAIPRDIQRPNAKPGGGGGGGGGGTVIGATWTGGGDVVLVVGKVFFTMAGVNYVCSGSVVDTVIGTVVLTAGHCVKDNEGVWATNFSFRPAYNNGTNPTLGSWTANDLFTTSLWSSTSNNAFDDDAGFAVVNNGTATTLEQAIQNADAQHDVHIPTIDFSGPTSPYSSFGYPAAGKYHGQTLTYCAGNLTGELDGQPGTQSIRCDMTGGSSGGPWYETFGNKGSTSVVSSLNSYGYSSLNGYMFGPIFGSGEAAAFNGAATGDCPASPSGYVCVDYDD